jgi:glycosidase
MQVRARTFSLWIAIVLVVNLSVFVPHSNAADLTSLAKPVARGDLSSQSVYFVVTDRYDNGDTANDTAGLTGDSAANISGYKPSDPGYYHGGDLKGLTVHLPDIKKLGFTSLWITPPVAGQYLQGGSADYHGYWGLNFTTIDPHLGTEADFKNLVNSAHSLGLKVILDIVVNHTADVISYKSGDYSYTYSPTSPYKTCAGKAFEPSHYAELPSFPLLCTNISFPKVPVLAPAMANAKKPAFLNDLTNYHNRGNTKFDGVSNLDGDFYGLDDLFTEKPQVLNGEIALWSSWITRFNIDGLRIDTAQYVNSEFWQAFIPAIEKVAHAAGHKTFPIFGEITNSDPTFTATYVTEESFPSVLDFPLQSQAQSFVVGSGYGGNMASFFNSDDYYTTASTSAYGLATFMSNHDMGRIGAAIYNSDQSSGDQVVLQRDELANAMLFLLRGGPIAYYGDEKGMTGSGGDKAARQDMFPTQVAQWQSEYRIGGSPIGNQSAFDVNNPLESVVTSLTSLKAKYPALLNGTQQVRYGQGNVFAVSRYAQHRELLVAFNDGSKDETFTSPVSTANTTWSTISGQVSQVAGKGNAVTLTLPAYGWVVLQANVPFAPLQAKPTISLANPAVDNNTPNWIALDATVPGTDFETVTFVVRKPGGAWSVVGSTDRRTFAADGTPGNLYRVYLHPTQYKVGSVLQVAAIVKDENGKSAQSQIREVKITAYS